MASTSGSARKALPQRTTRGNRMAGALAAEEQEEDATFWNQEFFAEEAADNDYEEEKVSEDVPDSDFNESEEEDDGKGSGTDEDEGSRRKKVLKPPGRETKKKPPSAAAVAARAARAAAAEDEDEEDEEVDEMDASPSGRGGGDGAAGSSGAKKSAKRARSPPMHLQAFDAPSLRRSTVSKTTEGAQARRKQDAKPKKAPTKKKDDGWRPMTQQELLAEAARTEVENTASLKLLLAREEETKRKAMFTKKNYQGPLVKYHSKKEKAADGVTDTAQMTLRVCNMHYPPPWLRRMRAPPPPPIPHCSVSGLPAKYRDPITRAPYAHLGALRRMRARSVGGAAAAADFATPVGLVSSSSGALTSPPVGMGTELDCNVRLVSSSSGALVSPPGVGGRGDKVTTAADRTKRGVMAAQVATELAQDDSALVAVGAPKGAADLPMELMALMVDLAMPMHGGNG
ncbi:hypothetical protein FOA52_007920 [Chlamydomonas sp. UWO 241]|nr:hypothetical protein FOA52_007920 [Chlamydomonas sp. UWO 241]